MKKNINNNDSNTNETPIIVSNPITNTSLYYTDEKSRQEFIDFVYNEAMKIYQKYNFLGEAILPDENYIKEHKVKKEELKKDKLLIDNYIEEIKYVVDSFSDSKFDLIYILNSKFVCQLYSKIKEELNTNQKIPDETRELAMLYLNLIDACIDCKKNNIEFMLEEFKLLFSGPDKWKYR